MLTLIHLQIQMADAAMIAKAKNNHKKGNKKRDCPRKRANSSTVSQISTEIWLMICKHLQNSPHTVFKLMLTCKTLRYSADNRWWKQYYEWVMSYQMGLRHSNYFYKLKQLYSLEDKKIALCLVFNHKCYFCGTRFGHRVFRPMMVRTCQPCLAKNLVSNISLELRYGMSFADFIELYKLKKGTVIPLDGFQCNLRKALMTLSDPDDKCHHEFVRFPFYHPKGTIFYFFKRDIENILNVKLDTQEHMQNERKEAAQFLSARFRRLANTTNITQRCVNVREIASCNEKYDKFRKSFFLDVSRFWVPGGPMYSCKCQYAKKENGGFLYYRPGFNLQMVQGIGEILSKEQIAISKMGRVNQLPPLPKKTKDGCCILSQPNCNFAILP
jgi:hypothetical protein